MLEALAALASTVSAMCAVFDLGVRHLNGELVFQRALREPIDPDTVAKLAETNTFVLDEIEAIQRRLERCYQHFVREGDGEQRVICLCSVLSDVYRGNGNNIPVDDWADKYRQLNCSDID